MPAGPKTEKTCKYFSLQASDGGSISIYAKKQLFSGSEFELIWANPCWFSLHHGRAEKGWLVK